MTATPRSTASPGRSIRAPAPVTAAAPGTRRLQWLARALVVAGLGMIPWLVLLAIELPASTVAVHWSTAWVGLDAMETIGLLATGTLLRRRDHRYCLAATVTATLVFADAWFDVTTSAPGLAQLVAIAMAAFIEVPVSVLCAALALRVMHSWPRTERSAAMLKPEPPGRVAPADTARQPALGDRSRPPGGAISSPTRSA
jgi:hypothetical protein